MTAKEAINILEPIRRSSAETSTGGFEHRPIVYALQTAIEALEKQIPKKPMVTNRATVCRCANCKAIVMQNLHTEKTDYCIRCGQAIDWEEVEK